MNLVLTPWCLNITGGRAIVNDIGSLYIDEIRLNNLYFRKIYNPEKTLSNMS